jgi:hypothetical protein
MTDADLGLATAQHWAHRFAQAGVIDWIAAGQASQAYHAADWETAQGLVAEIETADQFDDAHMRTTRGRISLAHGDLQAAITDAHAIASFATNTRNDEMLYFGLALAALCHAAAGREAEALETCDQFLSRWHESGGMTSRAIELCEITPIVATAYHHEQIRDAAQLLPEACRWRDALLLTADEHYTDAATLYEDIGSHPLAADARLLAARQAAQEGRDGDAQNHAEAVMTFADKAGATMYHQRAQGFLKASA